MNTTNLFVELIVIGIGALTWTLLVLLTALGFDWLPIDRAFSIEALVPVLSIVYVLGIITDRVADAIFDRWWSDDLRSEHFGERQEYYRARRQILTSSERLSDLLEYGRSRLRIARGWTLNAILIAMGLNLFVWTRLRQSQMAARLSVVGTLFLLTLAAGAWYAWQSISLAEYRKIKEQSEHVSLEESRG